MSDSYIQAVEQSIVEQGAESTEIALLNAENKRLRAALERQIQGFDNLLEFRKIARSDRYGALTREEIEEARDELYAALTGEVKPQ